MTAYDEDLAWIHDVGYGSFARDAAPGVLEVLRDRGAKTVVDIGCGSGIWARQLVDAGMQVVGVDLSPAMIKLARRRVPEAKFQVASWRDYRPAPADAFTALGEVLGQRADISIAPLSDELVRGRKIVQYQSHCGQSRP